jgi:hypothetical protein
LQRVIHEGSSFASKKKKAKQRKRTRRREIKDRKFKIITQPEEKGASAADPTDSPDASAGVHEHLSPSSQDKAAENDVHLAGSSQETIFSPSNISPSPGHLEIDSKRKVITPGKPVDLILGPSQMCPVFESLIADDASQEPSSSDEEDVYAIRPPAHQLCSECYVCCVVNDLSDKTYVIACVLTPRDMLEM